MRRAFFLVLVSVSCALAENSGLTAAQLAAKMADAVEDGESTARVKMSSPENGVLQILIKSRRTAGKAATAYGILWPNERKGEGFVLRQSGGSPQGAVKAAGGSTTVLGALTVKFYIDSTRVCTNTTNVYNAASVFFNFGGNPTAAAASQTVAVGPLTIWFNQRASALIP